jgi:hypothetical protein
MVLEDWFIGVDGVQKVITAVGMLTISERRGGKI